MELAFSIFILPREYLGKMIVIKRNFILLFISDLRWGGLTQNSMPKPALDVKKSFWKKHKNPLSFKTKILFLFVNFLLYDPISKFWL